MKNINTSGVTLLETNKYVDDLILEITTNPKSIEIICFKINADKMMEKILPHLLIALEKGTKISILADTVYTLKIFKSGLFRPITGAKKEVEKIGIKKTKEMFDKLKEAGAEIKFINKPTLFAFLPVIGRDHRKVVLIKKRSGYSVGYFGSVNFDAGDLNDYMLKVTNPKITDAIALTNSYFDKYRPKKDISIKCLPDFTLLLDLGRNFRSLIYKRSIKEIKSAKEKVVFLSQYPPELPLLFKLNKAIKRGVSVTIIIPNKNHNNDIFFKTALKIAELFSKFNKMEIVHISKGFTHAKILRVDDSVILGSHNLSNVGIACGTVELSCLTSRKEVIDEVDAFIKSIK